MSSVLRNVREEPDVARHFHGLRDFALVSRAQACFFFGPYFSETGKVTPKNLRVFMVNFLNIFFAKIAIHILRNVKCQNPNVK